MSWEKIPGWFSFQETYDQAVREAPQFGARFLEIGCALGRSAAYLGEKILESGKDIELHLVDPWEWGDTSNHEHHEILKNHGGVFGTFTHMMHAHAPQVAHADWLHCHKMTSDRAYLTMYKPESFDMVFIDANHDYDPVKYDIRTWVGAVKSGGIIAGDDYSEKHYPGVVRAVQELFGSKAEIRERDGWKHWFMRVEQ